MDRLYNATTYDKDCATPSKQLTFKETFYLFMCLFVCLIDFYTGHLEKSTLGGLQSNTDRIKRNNKNKTINNMKIQDGKDESNS